MNLKPRYTLTALLAAILLAGLPLAWVRHKLDERAAYREQLSELPERGILVTYHGLPQHPWYAFFEGVQNPEQAQKIVMSGPQIGDDDLRQFDAFPHVEEIQLFTNVTDERASTSCTPAPAPDPGAGLREDHEGSHREGASLTAPGSR